METRPFAETVRARAERDATFAACLLVEPASNSHIGSSLDEVIATLSPERQRAIHERAQKMAAHYRVAWHNRHIMRRKIRLLLT